MLLRKFNLKCMVERGVINMKGSEKLEYLWWVLKVEINFLLFYKVFMNIIFFFGNRFMLG